MASASAPACGALSSSRRPDTCAAAVKPVLLRRPKAAPAASAVPRALAAPCATSNRQAAPKAKAAKAQKASRTRRSVDDSGEESGDDSCSNAFNEDSGDGSGEETDELATDTKQKRALEEQEPERELSAYERQRNTNVQL